jgi:hypothetical protein
MPRPPDPYNVKRRPCTGRRSDFAAFQVCRQEVTPTLAGSTDTRDLGGVS